MKQPILHPKNPSYSPALLIPTYLIICSFLINSTGGIDLIAYKIGSSIKIPDWTVYFYKEFFSWTIIKISYEAADLFGLKQPIIFINLLLLTICAFFTKNSAMRVSLLPLALISPISILLTFNVLRQYISIVLLCLVILNLLHRNWKTSALLAFLSLFSHQSVVLLIPTIYACYFFKLRTVTAIILLSQLSIFALNSFAGIDIYSDQGYTEVTDTPSIYKMYFYLAYIALIFVVLRFAKKSGDFLFLETSFISKLISAILIFSIATAVFPWPTWIINRILTSTAFILIFLFFSLKKHRGSKGDLLAAALVTFNIFGILFHGGALSMISL